MHRPSRPSPRRGERPREGDGKLDQRHFIPGKKRANEKNRTFWDNVRRLGVPLVKFRQTMRGDMNREINWLQQQSARRQNEVKSFSGVSFATRNKKENQAKKGAFTFRSDKHGLSVINALLHSNGFSRTRSTDFSVWWGSRKVRHSELKSLKRWQRINQFPNTFGITRKDNLCRNIVKMQQTHGFKYFDFVPRTFVLPQEQDEFKKFAKSIEMLQMNRSSVGSPRRHNIKAKSTLSEFVTKDVVPPVAWIIKPSAAACGRGIFITNNTHEAIERSRLMECAVVSQYISNPLLIDGLKFDLRLYVVVVSFYPLVIYLYIRCLYEFQMY